MRGTFISIDGIDGTGKSTLLPALGALLTARGIDHITTREPGGTAIGEAVREILLLQDLAPEAELMLFFAARAELVRNVIEPALAAGQWVLSDRFVDSSFAYQGAGRELGQARVQDLADWLLPQETQPDRIFILDADVATALGRARGGQTADRFEAERSSFFERARACYLARAAADRQRYRVIDTSGTVAEATATVTTLIEDLL